MGEPEVDLRRMFGPSGWIAQYLPEFEYRPQQLEMAELVDEAFQESHHLIVEAGTGVGKSFAYLIPAIQFACQHGERVLISTHTISLQEQLIFKDIPFLQEILPYEFKAVLAKGRGNYLSLRRLQSLLTSEQALFDTKDEVAEIQRLVDWAEETHDGTLTELDPQPRYDIWDRVKSESDNCLRYLCPTFGECFYYRARHELKDAQLIIANHHLVFTDLALRKLSPTYAVLPSYEYLILDEAHHLEDVATEHVGISFSNIRVKRLLDSLVHPQKEAGLFRRLESRAGEQLIKRIREEANRQFEAILEWAQRRGGYDEQTGGDVQRVDRADAIPHLLDEPMRTLEAELRKLELQVQEEDEVQEVVAHRRRCMQIRQDLEIMIQQKYEGYVYWVEVKRGRQMRISLNAAPVSVAEELQNHLFQTMSSVVMTSATLATNQDFNYFRQRIGIMDGAGRIVGSPFNYERQVQIYLPRQMPDPRSPGFTSAAVEQIKKYLKKTQGKAFVLFTSYRMMDEVYEQVEPYLSEMGIRSFKQGGELSRHIMLEEFREDISSVLFGTSSFWEGVDVPGKALSNVIIVKLPFAVPTHPITESRMKAIEDRGGNAFMEYSLPEAILRFKQGFGRLIRSQTDRGIVVVLDPRIRTKFYGRQFLASLPNCRVILA